MSHSKIEGDTEKIKEALVFEKKKVREQEIQLFQNKQEMEKLKKQVALLKSESSSSLKPEEVIKLKKLVRFYKNKYEETQGLLQQNPMPSINSSEEIEALKNALAKEKNTSKTLSEELEALRLQQQKLKEYLKESQEHISLLKKELQASNQVEKKLHDNVSDKNLQEIQLLKEENEKIGKQLQESKQRSSQLERVIQYLRERHKEAQQETEQLQNELRSSKNTLVNFTEKVQQLEAKLEEERNSLLKEQELREEAQCEAASLQGQFQILKKKIGDLQEECDVLNAQIHDERKNKETLLSEKEAFEQLIKIKDEGIISIQNDITEIKHSLVKGISESKDIENRYHETVQEKAALFSKAQQLQQQLENERENLRSAHEQLQKAKSEIAEWISKSEVFNKERHNVERVFKSKEEEVARLQETNQALEVVRHQIEEERNHLQLTLDKLHISYEDIENRLKIAQQHLAKKVKENADLNEKIKNIENETQSFQTEIGHSQTQVIELQKVVEGYIQQEKWLNEQLQHAKKVEDEIVEKWEGKYFKVYEKWQESELRLKELKKLEEKYIQMQAFLGSIGNFFPAQMQSTPAQERLPLKEMQMENESIPPSQKKSESSPRPDEEVKDSIEKSPYQNLFEMPSHSRRIKQNLFE